MIRILLRVEIAMSIVIYSRKSSLVVVSNEDWIEGRPAFFVVPLANDGANFLFVCACLGLYIQSLSGQVLLDKMLLKGLFSRVALAIQLPSTLLVAGVGSPVVNQ